MGTAYCRVCGNQCPSGPTRCPSCGELTGEAHGAGKPVKLSGSNVAASPKRETQNSPKSVGLIDRLLMFFKKTQVYGSKIPSLPQSPDVVAEVKGMLRKSRGVRDFVRKANLAGFVTGEDDRSCGRLMKRGDSLLGLIVLPGPRARQDLDPHGDGIQGIGTRYAH